MPEFRYAHSIRFLNTPSSDLYKLFISGVSRSISITFLMVFSSVYIYNLVLSAGYSATTSISAAITFNIILFVIKGAAVMSAEDYSRVHGFKNTIETSLLPFVLSIMSFLLSEYNIFFLVPAAIFWGIHAGYYWWGYHGYFIKSGDYEHFGKELGQVGVLETVAAILTPLIGSVIINLFGFRSIYILSLVFMFVAVYLISKGQDKRQKHDTDIDEMLYLLRKHKSSAVAYVGSAVQGQIQALFWPLFLFLFFGSVLDMGAVLSVSIFIASILGVFFGDMNDKFGEKKLISYGTPLFVSSWLIRAFSSTTGLFVAADAIWNVGQKMVDIPLMALSYKKAVEKYTARAILFRELSITFGAAIGLFIVLVIFLITPRFEVIFLGAVLISMLTLAPVIAGEFNGKKKR